MSAQAIAVEATPWNPLREALRAGWVLGVREMRTSIRTPAYLIPNLVVPIFFFFVMVGGLQEFAGSFGIENWKAFQLPVAILFAAQGGSAGLNMVADIESGYLDKLLVTPASRLSILVGAMTADLMRVTAQATIVLLVGAAAGVHFETGVLGALVLISLSGLYGLSYSGLGFAMALKTGNAQSTQTVQFLFLPLLFLTTLFAPKEALSGWLATAATLQPAHLPAGGDALALDERLGRQRSRRRDPRARRVGHRQHDTGTARVPWAAALTAAHPSEGARTAARLSTRRGLGPRPTTLPNRRPHRTRHPQTRAQ